MKYFKKDIKSDKIVCLLCKHYCHLGDGQIGLCGVNQNVDSKLVNLVYSHPSVINVDPVEKKPLYHFLPGSMALSVGTVGCNFKCPFCQNWNISQSKDIDTNTIITPQDMIKLAKKYKCNSIAYTYNEPTVFYPYAKDIGVLAKENGIKNIFVSNGFESEEVIKDMKLWLDGANIDLKSWNDEYYKKVLKGGLESVKNNIIGMKKEGIWVEVTTLLIDGENDNDEDIRAMAEFLYNEVGSETPWHLSAFHPDYKMKDRSFTAIQTLQKAYEIAKKVGLKYVYIGNIAMHNDTICPQCGKLLIDRISYDVVKNEIREGRCPDCGRAIEGVWR